MLQRFQALQCGQSMGMSLGGGLGIPFFGFRQVHLDAESLFAEASQIVLSTYVPFFGCMSKPADCFLRVLIHAPSIGVADT